MKAFCLLMLAGGLCWAQGTDAVKEPAKFYKLDFVVKDLEAGKGVTAKNYSIIVSSGGRGEIRADSKVNVGGPTFEIGTDIDCFSISELHDALSIEISARVSSLLQESDPHPVVRENRWRSNVVVPLKKPTVVFSSDDNTTKRVMQVEVTATPRL